MSAPFDSPQCLITGLALRCPEGWKVADLYRFGDRFIVRASGKDWQQGAPHYEREVKLPAVHWNRDNVYIMEAERSFLNSSALLYIEKNAREYGAPSL